MFEPEDILRYRSLAIVGLAKNTGKTECLNYILRKVGDRASRFALTSIGVDGEKTDRVCQTEKPEITVPEGMVFVTSEKHYREKRLVAEVLDISDEQTALGRLVTARAVTEGKVLLSGPAHTGGLRRLIAQMQKRGVQTTLVDGALSRLSLASPTVTEAMVLATGAAVSGNIAELVRQTKYVYELVGLEEVGQEWQDKLEGIEQGCWALTEDGQVEDLHLPSVFMLEKAEGSLLRDGCPLFVAGAVSDKLLQHLRLQKCPVELVVRDFTRIFALPESYYAFLRKGGRIRVLHRSRLMAVTVNPVAPSGLVLDSERLCREMEDALHIPVYDVKRAG